MDNHRRHHRHRRTGSGEHDHPLAPMVRPTDPGPGHDRSPPPTNDTTAARPDPPPVAGDHGDAPKVAQRHRDDPSRSQEETTYPSHPDARPASAPLQVRVDLVVLTGPEAATLMARQAAVVRDALVWLTTRDDHADPPP